MTTTDRRARPKHRAAASPAGPPPTMMTSTCPPSFGLPGLLHPADRRVCFVPPVGGSASSHRSAGLLRAAGRRASRRSSAACSQPGAAGPTLRDDSTPTVRPGDACGAALTPPHTDSPASRQALGVTQPHPKLEHEHSVQGGCGATIRLQSRRNVDDSAGQANRPCRERGMFCPIFRFAGRIGGLGAGQRRTNWQRSIGGLASQKSPNATATLAFGTVSWPHRAPSPPSQQ